MGDLGGSILSSNSIGPEGAKAIAEALEVNRVLTSCDLMLNNIGVEGAKALASALEVNRVLTELNLSTNRLCGVWNEWDGQKGTYMDESITALAEALKINGVLTSVSLRDNCIGPSGATAI